jgi:excisionase family DNA binding protein
MSMGIGAEKKGAKADETTAPPRLFTMIEAAQYFRVSRRTFQDIIQRQPFYRTCGRRKLFSAADLEAIWNALPGPAQQK